MHTELIERFKRRLFDGKSLTLKIKFHYYKQITHSNTQAKELAKVDCNLPVSKELLRQVDYESHPVRLIGLSVSNPKEEIETIEDWLQLKIPFEEWK